jgi:hypothetical protein
MFRRNWRRVDGRLIESRDLRPRSSGAVAHPQECIVEFTGNDGRTVRLAAYAAIGIMLPDKGGVIPLLVKPDDSKAVVDRSDPRINLHKLAAARREAERERFDRELPGKDR